MREEGDKMRFAEEKSEGISLGLEVRQMAQLRCIYAKACNMDNKLEELEATIW